MAAKIQAESDYANARTQQQAERAERAIKDSLALLKVQGGAGDYLQVYLTNVLS